MGLDVLHGGPHAREELDFDYASEQMIADGALSRYKVLLILWGAIIEKPALERIDRWVREGGILVFCPRARGNPVTVEGDGAISNRWVAGDTGKGKVIVWRGEVIPGLEFSEGVKGLLLKTPVSTRGSRPRCRCRNRPPRIGACWRTGSWRCSISARARLR